MEEAQKLSLYHITAAFRACDDLGELVVGVERVQPLRSQPVEARREQHRDSLRRRQCQSGDCTCSPDCGRIRPCTCERMSAVARSNRASTNAQACDVVVRQRNVVESFAVSAARRTGIASKRLRVVQRSSDATSRKGRQRLAVSWTVVSVANAFPADPLIAAVKHRRRRRDKEAVRDARRRTQAERGLNAPALGNVARENGLAKPVTADRRCGAVEAVSRLDRRRKRRDAGRTFARSTSDRLADLVAHTARSFVFHLARLCVVATG